MMFMFSTFVSLSTLACLLQDFHLCRIKLVLKSVLRSFVDRQNVDIHITYRHENIVITY
jgi:hypothetical protein